MQMVIDVAYASRRWQARRLELHDASIILNSLTWYWRNYRRLANVICFFLEKQASAAPKDPYRPSIFSFPDPHFLVLAVNKFPAASIFIRALDHF